MNLGYSRRVLFYLGLVIGGLLFVYQFWSGSQAFQFKVSQFAILPMLASVVIIAIVNALQIGIWAHLMSALDVSIEWRQAAKGYVLSALARYIPGGIWGYLSRSEWLFQTHSVSHKRSNSASVLEVLGLVVAVGVITGGYWGTLESGQLQLALYLLTLLFPLGIWGIVHLATRLPLLQWVSNKELLEINSKRISLKRWLMVIVLYIALWFGFGEALLLVMHSLNVSLNIGVLDATFLFAVAWLWGFVFVFIPSGLGIREFVLSSLIVSRLGVSLELASAISVVMRFIILVVELIYLLVGLVIA